jgi:hypothetical protein
MYSFAKFLADHLLLQNREQNIKKFPLLCAIISGRFPLVLGRKCVAHCPPWMLGPNERWGRWALANVVDTCFGLYKELNSFFSLYF